MINYIRNNICHVIKLKNRIVYLTRYFAVVYPPKQSTGNVYWVHLHSVTYTAITMKYGYLMYVMKWNYRERESAFKEYQIRIRKKCYKKKHSDLYIL
jgi:hypothetical protein